MHGIFLPEWLQFVLVVLGFVAMLFGPGLLAGLCEKRLVWPYIPMEETKVLKSWEPLDDDNPYAVGRAVEDASSLKLTDHAAKANDAANRLGFEPLGVFRDGKAGIYQVRYDLWRSSEGDVLAVIGGGSLAVIPVRASWLITRLRDGHCLVTIDDSKASEIDLAGLTAERLIPHADFEKLVEWHRSWIAASPVPIAPFSEIDPLADLQEMKKQRIDRLEELGLASYLDSVRTAWRYTPRGALVFSFRAVFLGMRRAAWPDTRLSL